MSLTKELPCTECCKLNMSCCSNPQILFTMVEIDKIFSEHPGAMEGKVLYKGEIPGMVYVLFRPPEGVDTVRLESCVFYENEKCSIFEHRSIVCKTYGDPKYNECPYQDYAEPGSLTELVNSDLEKAEGLHQTAKSQPLQFYDDFIEPYVKSFESSDPEYMDFWEKLPEPNFIRKTPKENGW